MPGTPIWNLPYPAQTPEVVGPDVPADLKALADAIDAKLTPTNAGLAAARPAVGSAVGHRYIALDSGTEYVWSGVAWIATNGPIGVNGIVTNGRLVGLNRAGASALALDGGGAVSVNTDETTISRVSGALALMNNAVSAAKVAAALKPSAGAAAATETLRALGTIAGTAFAGNDGAALAAFAARFRWGLVDSSANIIIGSGGFSVGGIGVAPFATYNIFFGGAWPVGSIPAGIAVPISTGGAGSAMCCNLSQVSDRRMDVNLYDHGGAFAGSAFAFIAISTA